MYYIILTYLIHLGWDLANRMPAGILVFFLSRYGQTDNTIFIS